MPIQRWNYKSQDASVKHIGPTAQDFAAASAQGDDSPISIRARCVPSAANCRCKGHERLLSR